MKSTPQQQPRDPDRPKVVFPGSYILTAEQETQLIDDAIERVEELEKELGRNDVQGEGWWTGEADAVIKSRAGSFMGKRQLYELMYEGNMDWRADVLGGIFKKSNWIVPIVKRVIMQQVARANAHFYGSDPWFSADAEGNVDVDLAKAAGRWIKFKFRKARIRHKMEGGTEGAFVRGETVMKRSYKRRDDLYRSRMTILIDEKGNPVLDATGAYITENRFKPVEIETGGIIKRKPKTVLVYAGDGVTQYPEGGKFEERLVERRKTLANGPELEECYFKDFLCPLTAPSIEEADCVAHLYPVPVSELADQWRRHEAGTGEEQRNIDTRNAIDAITEMEGNTAARWEEGEESRAAHADYRTERPEDQAAADMHGYLSGAKRSATANIVEIWIRGDWDEDDVDENILLVIDRDTRVPIYYDFVAEVTPDGKRPFTVKRPHAVPGRWYGIGSVQIYEQIQHICDLELNRINFGNSNAGRTTFWRPDLTREGENDPDLKLNDGGTYTPLEGVKVEDILQYVTLPNTTGENLKDLLEFYLQMAMNMSGVQHANDAAMAGLHSAKTATSVINISDAGHEMFGQIISRLEEGITECADGIAELCIVNMDNEETYLFLKDDEPVSETIKRSDMQHLSLMIRLTITKFKTEQAKANLQEARAAAKEFYLEFSPEQQVRVAPLYQQDLELLQIRDAKEIIQPLSMPEVITDPAAGDVETEGMQAHHGLPEPAGPVDQFEGQMDGGRAGGTGMAASEELVVSSQ